MSGNGFPLRSQVHEARLENGLTVLVCEDRRAPVAAVVTHVRAGYFDETDDVVGISHVLEHMFFKGTARRGPGEMARETKALGGQLNAGTIYDRTTYYTVVPAAGLEHALDIQSDALKNSVMDEDELRRELRVIIEEAKRKLDSPPAVARETLYATMFDRHRIRRWRIGTESQLERLTRADVVRFYRGHYRAPEVVLCIAGDVEAGHVLDLVERHYGDMPAVGPDRDMGPDEPERTGFRFREIDGDITQTHLECGWRTPGPLHPDTPAMDLFAVVLGQGRASRLYRGVREAGLATEIAAWNYTPGSLGVFGVGAVTRPEDARQALDAAFAVTEGARRGPIHAAELDRARNIMEARLVRRFESVQGQATLLAQWHALGSWTLFARHWEGMMSAGVDDLLRVAGEYLLPDRATVLAYRPAGAAAVAWTFEQGRTAMPASEEAWSPPALGDRRERIRIPTANVEDGVHQFRTDGLHIVVLPRRAVPLVSIAVCMQGGSPEEPIAETGVTRLMLRTSIKGTANRTARRLAEETESLGGSIAPGAAADAFEWTLTLPSKHLERGTEILSDVVLNASFPEAELERERKAMLSEALLLRDDMFRYPHQLFLEAAFPEDPYGRPLESMEAAVAGASVGTIAAWHDRTVLDRTPTLFVVGDVDPVRAAEIGAAYMAGARGGSSGTPARVAWPAHPRRRIVTRETAQTALVLGFPGPDRNDPDHDTLRVLSAAVGGLGGRLFEELRSRRSLAYTVSAYPIARLRGGAFVSYIATSPGREDEARAGLVEELLRLTADPLSHEEVERARQFLIGSRQIQLQTNGARLAELAGALLLGGGLTEIREQEDRIRAVSPAMIRDAAQRWFDVSRIVEGAVRGTGRAS